MALDDRCNRCKRIRAELNKLDIGLRRIGDYRHITYICEDCLFNKTIG